MIEINLLEHKKPFKLPTILGIDPSKISIKGMLFSLVLYYSLDFYLMPLFNEEIDKEEGNNRELQAKIDKLQDDINKNSDVKEKLVLFNKQIERLKERSTQVDKIIQERSNPKELLENIARKMPEDLWFKSLIVDSQNKVEIKGEASSYKSIGSFISMANETPFFKNTLTLGDTATRQENISGQDIRIETFVVKGEVVNFNPLVQ